MKAVAIARTNLRRLFRERSTIFFVFVLPMLIILLLGATFGGGLTPRIGVVAEPGELGEALVAALSADHDLDVIRYGSPGELESAVERGRVDAGVELPEDYDATVRSGGTASLRFLARPDQLGPQLRAAVAAAAAGQAAELRAARFAVRETGSRFEAALARAGAIAPALPAVAVEETTAGEALTRRDLGTFDLGASQQLLLFVFLTSLTGASALMETRRLGIARRMLSTPTPARAILIGEALGRFAVALVQGIFIVAGTLLLFHVDWGDPLGAAALLLAFCLVGSGAGMLLGATFRSEQQAVSVSLLAGLGLAALGGSMVPLEVFPPAVRDVAHVTPHAWGNDAFAELVRDHGGIGDILLELGVLLGLAVLLLSLAAWRLRRAITR
ncbi:MAG: ABC transporter permease [Thermoleophilia bacterium]|nr:ABC transporter permease [Thermoleophilia bacterium]